MRSEERPAADNRPKMAAFEAFSPLNVCYWLAARSPDNTPWIVRRPFDDDWLLDEIAPDLAAKTMAFTGQPRRLELAQRRHMRTALLNGRRAATIPAVRRKTQRGR